MSSGNAEFEQEIISLEERADRDRGQGMGGVEEF